MDMYLCNTQVGFTLRVRKMISVDRGETTYILIAHNRDNLNK